MLRRLHIRDFVIVDELELDLGTGFGALTGETGAGKSILVDALSLALGERADPIVVRAGRERAEIVAEFDLLPDSAACLWLRTNDIETEADVCLLRRVVDVNGRSRAYINGTPVTRQQLREIGDTLVDIHGQHAHHALLRSDAQRVLLDTHAGLTETAQRVAGLYRTWQQMKQARIAAEKNSAGAAHEREILDWQLAELQALEFDPRQWLEAGQEHRRLAHAATLLAGAEEALTVIDEGGNEDELAAAPQVRRIGALLDSLAELDPQLKESRELLESAAIQLNEAAHALRRYRERLEIDPQRLAEIENRIQTVEALARKHRVAPDALPSLLAQLQTRLAQLQLLSDPAALIVQETQSHGQYLDEAARLSQGRAKTAAALSKEVTRAMQDLAMGGGKFEIALEPLAEGAAHGLENIEFLVAANPKQTPRPLARVASGGELSRIGLAIQVIASSAGEAPTLIFDEVDVGIGGRAAEIVGRMLKQLGQQRQVLCVTHLPQVAAQADWQWSVVKEKIEAGGEVVSRVITLDSEGRINEIARMLGGVNLTETTRDHAREMLGLKPELKTSEEPAASRRRSKSKA